MAQIFLTYEEEERLRSSLYKSYPGGLNMEKRYNWAQLASIMTEEAQMKALTNKNFTSVNIGKYYRTYMQPHYNKDPTGATRLGHLTVETAQRARKDVDLAAYKAKHLTQRADAAITVMYQSKGAIVEAIALWKLTYLAAKNADDSEAKLVASSYDKVYILAGKAMHRNDKAIKAAQDMEEPLKGAQGAADLAGTTLKECDSLIGMLSVQITSMPEAESSKMLEILNTAQGTAGEAHRTNKESEMAMNILMTAVAKMEEAEESKILLATQEAARLATKTIDLSDEAAHMATTALKCMLMNGAKSASMRTVASEEDAP